MKTNNVPIKHDIVYNLPGNAESGRNGEDSFIRTENGAILFAYSHYSTSSTYDDAPCDIAMIRSEDEGVHWSDPIIIACSSDFGVKNIVSVSGMNLTDGRICFFFIVRNDDDGSSWLGRTISDDGIHFKSSRCGANKVQRAYYVFNNDRFIRLSDGRIAAVAAKYDCSPSIDENQNCFESNRCAVPVCFVSDDEGETFTATKARVLLSGRLAQTYGMEEPGIIELPGNVIWLWARTTLCYQYQCFSFDGMNTFTMPEPSEFTSPRSPLEMYRASDNTLWAAYNPIPHYNGCKHIPSTGRTPLVLRSSIDDGKSWGTLYTVEDDPDANYCYPSMIETRDNSILLSYGTYYYNAIDAINGHPHINTSMRIAKIRLQ